MVMKAEDDDNNDEQQQQLKQPIMDYQVQLKHDDGTKTHFTQDLYCVLLDR